MANHPNPAVQRSPIQRLRNIDRLLTAKQLSAILGYPRGRIYELERRGEIPSIRLGRARRFDGDAIAAWLESGGTSGREP